MQKLNEIASYIRTPLSVAHRRVARVSLLEEGLNTKREGRHWDPNRDNERNFLRETEKEATLSSA